MYGATCRCHPRRWKTRRTHKGSARSARARHEPVSYRREPGCARPLRLRKPACKNPSRASRRRRSVVGSVDLGASASLLESFSGWQNVVIQTEEIGRVVLTLKHGEAP